MAKIASVFSFYPWLWFLHGDLEDEVYVEQPFGFVARGSLAACVKSTTSTLWPEAVSSSMVWEV